MLSMDQKELAAHINAMKIYDHVVERTRAPRSFAYYLDIFKTLGVDVRNADSRNYVNELLLNLVGCHLLEAGWEDDGTFVRSEYRDKRVEDLRGKLFSRAFRLNSYDRHLSDEVHEYRRSVAVKQKELSVK